MLLSPVPTLEPWSMAEWVGCPRAFLPYAGGLWGSVTCPPVSVLSCPSPALVASRSCVDQGPHQSLQTRAATKQGTMTQFGRFVIPLDPAQWAHWALGFLRAAMPPFVHHRYHFSALSG